MKTPCLITPEELTELIILWLRTQCWMQGDSFRCNVCNEAISGVSVAFYLHESRIGGCCVGYQGVRYIPIPFCRHCEERPEGTGCLHVVRKAVERLA